MFLIDREGVWVIERLEAVGKGAIHLRGIRDVSFAVRIGHIDIIIGGLCRGRMS